MLFREEGGYGRGAGWEGGGGGRKAPICPPRVSRRVEPLLDNTDFPHVLLPPTHLPPLTSRACVANKAVKDILPTTHRHGQMAISGTAWSWAPPPSLPENYSREIGHRFLGTGSFKIWPGDFGLTGTGPFNILAPGLDNVTG